MVANTFVANEHGVPEHLATVIRALTEPALLVSGTGYVLVANRAARNALHLDAERPGSTLFAELVSDPPERVLASIKAWTCTAESLPGAFSVSGGGETLTYACKAALVVPPSEGAPSIVLVRFWPRREASPFVLLNQKIAELNDEIARRRSAEEALRRSEAALRDRANEAEAMNRSKDEFLATLSHELRTPLNAILGWATLLREGRLGEDKRERAVETIERNARAQARLVDELLDVSRIVTGKLRLNVHELDPLPVVEAALDGIRPSAQAKGVRLRAALDPHTGWIVADPDRLQQICWNLLSNAVKFTPKGGAIDVFLQRGSSAVELIVADTGKGILADFLPYVFDRFRQQDPSITRSFAGLGLGLSIVKSLVELHGGTVRVDSAGDGKGTTFVVELPPAGPRSTGELPVSS
jgi:signal transduction histidine kinase